MMHFYHNQDCPDGMFFRQHSRDDLASEGYVILGRYSDGKTINVLLVRDPDLHRSDDATMIAFECELHNQEDPHTLGRKWLCPNCNVNSQHTFIAAAHDSADNTFHLPKVHMMVHCESCGHNHVIPRNGEDVLKHGLD